MPHLFEKCIWDYDYDDAVPVLLTERLVIRPVLEQDAADIFEIRGDDDTADDAGVPCMESIDEAVDYIGEHLYSENCFCILLKGEVIGLIEIYGDSELPTDSDYMGYYMKKEYRCNGYMTEALIALRKMWKEEGTEIPMLWIFPGNNASCRVAEKSGWSYIDTCIVDINCFKNDGIGYFNQPVEIWG